MVNIQQLIKTTALIAVFFTSKIFSMDFITEDMTSPPSNEATCKTWHMQLPNGEQASGYMDTLASQALQTYKDIFGTNGTRRNWTKKLHHSVIDPANHNCRRTYEFNYDLYQSPDHEDPMLEGANVRNTMTSAPEMSEQCPSANDSGTAASIPTQRFGSLRCIAPSTLFANQNCPISPTEPGFALPYDGSGNTNVCITKSDGSKCGYSLNNNNYVSDPEINCWTDSYPDDYVATNNFNPDENGCGSVGGYNFCEANPDNVCIGTGDAQVCAPGCGSVEVGEQQYFGCFDNENSCNPSTDDCGNNPNTPEQEDPSDGQEPGQQESEEPTFDTSKLESLIEVSNERLNGLNGTAQGISTKLTDTNSKLNTIVTGIDGTNEQLVELNGTNDDMRNGIGALNDKAAGILSQMKGEETNMSDLTNAAKQAELESLSFYNPKYENGFEDVWDKNYALMQQTSMFQYIESWEINVSGSDYQFPEICFNLGFADYGCHQISIDSRVFPFIRILMILGALFLARKLTLGG